MKLSKEELKKKIDEVITDEDLKISLLEDIEDSMTEVESEGETVTKEEYDKVVSERDEIKQKYKDRFLSGEETKEVEVEQADGTKTKETKVIREANEHYSLRYTEALIVECKYLRRCIARLTARIEELEKGNNSK